MNSTTGSISVTITDNDNNGKYSLSFIFHLLLTLFPCPVCSIPPSNCESKCNQRSNARENTFQISKYTYGKFNILRFMMLIYHTLHVSFAAAHIELLGIVHYETCTAVNAHIIQCWELQDNTCPPVNTSLTIPTCASCPILRPLNVSDHYLIAGVQDTRSGQRRIMLPSNRKTGLFAPWDDIKYADIANWV